MHEMELGYKPRIFTFLNIWQDVGEPSKMPNDGFVRVLGWGVCCHRPSVQHSWLLSSKCQYRPSIFVSTADFYRFPKVGLNRGTGSEDLGSLSVTEEVDVWVGAWLRSEGAGGLWRAPLTPCPGLLRTEELFSSSLDSPLLVVSSSAFSLLPHLFPWIAPFLLAPFSFVLFSR